ncbi:hypothetical protein ASE05_31850 [Mesorhizobium sp. Root172]|nr:hypothetical protein ASE05_31850 [Mesorhizobium sp. Root172]
MITQSASLLKSLRREAVALFLEGVAAANPEQAVAAALVERSATLEQASRIILVAFGKAACPMARAAMPFVRDRLATAIALTNHENVEPVDGATVIAGDTRSPIKAALQAQPRSKTRFRARKTAIWFSFWSAAVARPCCARRRRASSSPIRLLSMRP